ncbi:hypothetical protein Lesp02_81570 [Lentzea sp. NBRC 105346]|uniref:hypothetical protein n=1 Tax=Lentzea sp. NBRC 105346 TaxID=3032205 RepID=UPI0024A377D3|nr:hypothetical protein [Lentzea sp. NBRC 105346]GLZ35970.1 hypothetical protein Lesp02_81570 [Lentzea sp. NBRC 105346]
MRALREKDLTKLAEHYDTTDLSSELEHAELDETVDPDPMITTSLRLPKSVLDRVRARAADEGVKPTALMRRWVEQASANDVSTLEELMRQVVHDELAPVRQFIADHERSAG